MNVSHFHTLSGQTAQELMQRLNIFFLAQGWVLAYIDALAIGAGTIANPAWDANQSAFPNTSLGVACYRMPNTPGTVTQWVIALYVDKGNTVNEYNVYVRTFKNMLINGLGTDPGSLCGFQVNNNPNRSAGEHFISVTETGFAIGQALNSQYGMQIGVERKHKLDQTILDDIVIHGLGPNCNPTPALDSKGAALSRNAISGEAGQKPYVYFWNTNNNNQDVAVPSLAGSNNLLSIPAGPFINSGGLGGMSAHMVFLPINDTPPGQDQQIEVNGTNQVFFNAFNANFHKYYTAFIKS